MAAASLACLGPLWLAGCSPSPPPAAPPSEAGVYTTAVVSVPLDLTYAARARGEREVEVRAKVSGTLLKRFYREGATVAEGELLFEIDPARYRAEVASARGRVGVEQARLAEAEAQKARVQKLFALGVSAGRERDLAESAEAAARAALTAAQADLRRAELDLGYTQVRAPIAGITGREARSEGSLVNATDETSLLTTLSQTGRLYVDFTMPEDEARLIRAALAAGADAVRVRLGGPDGRPLAEAARIEFLDARVDADTGTVEARAVFDNSGGVLAPGQFVQARLEGLRSGEGLYVPVRAVMHGVDGPYVWKLDAANAVAMQPVKVGEAVGNLQRVDSGLAAGDRIVTDGVLKLAPGLVVKPAPVELQSRPAGVVAGP